jgi:hypothetical protein
MLRHKKTASGDQIYILGFPGTAEMGGSGEEPGVEATLTAGRAAIQRYLMPLSCRSFRKIQL